MAAESVVSFLISKLDSFLVEEAKFLKDVSTEVRWIKDELQIMKAFLRDADSRANSDAVVKTWVKQVREVAYDIEDVLDEFVLQLKQAPIHHGDEVKGFLGKIMQYIEQPNKRRRIANQIQELRTRIVDISSRKENFDFKMIKLASSSSNRSSDQVSHLRSTARFVEEADLVGIDKPRNELIGLLVDGGSRLRTISVVGMGGLGKTTLVGKVYDSKRVKTEFEAFAWVPVSQTFTIDDIFRSMAKQICEGRIIQVDAMGKEKLIEMLRSYLQQKRYVIVLDDLWKVDDWECLRIGLPNGECGSRIMVTTRNSEVAAACARTSDHVYNLQPLPFKQGWTLFCRKAFQTDLGGNCPPYLQPLSEKIVRKCGGLPLAIAAIGSLLLGKSKNLVEWQKLYNSLGHQIESSSNLTSMNQILSLSFDDLPSYLRPCFIYVSIFPEDHLIRRMRLIQLWVAEGFVERKEGMTLEEVANDYLHELINRSLIQVVSYTDYGTIKACRVHDVVREIVLSKAREEIFLKIPNGTEVSDKTRRLAVHDSENIVPKNDLSHVRTFVVFGDNRWPDSLMNAWISGFKLLKVLDLEGTGVNKFPSEIVNLFHLRFLSLRNTWIRTLPESIGKLKNLESLDLQDTCIWELPTSIVKLEYLRHLLVHYKLRSMIGVKMIPGVGGLRSLQQLGYIKIDQSNSCMVRELGKLTQLKWLGISELTSEDGFGLCASINKMTCLSSLSASSVYEGLGLLDLKSLSSPPPLLEHVHLRGRLEELPQWIPSLSNLVHLTLKWSGLKEDPLSALQHLSNLMKLRLIGAYDGKELCCEREGFQMLKSLFLFALQELKFVRVEKGAMPSLQKLHIRQCMELEKVPFGIEHLTHLKELHFDDTAETLRKTIERDGGEDHWKISHVPLLKFDRWCILFLSTFDLFLNKDAFSSSFWEDNMNKMPCSALPSSCAQECMSNDLRIRPSSTDHWVGWGLIYVV